MDELKELYDVELTDTDKLALAVGILTDEYIKTVKILGKASNAQQRIIALSKQEAINYALERLVDTNERTKRSV